MSVRYGLRVLEETPHLQEQHDCQLYQLDQAPMYQHKQTYLYQPLAQHN